MRGLLFAGLPGMQMGAGWNINTFQGKKKSVLVEYEKHQQGKSGK